MQLLQQLGTGSLLFGQLCIWCFVELVLGLTVCAEIYLREASISSADNDDRWQSVSGNFFTLVIIAWSQVYVHTQFVIVDKGCIL